MATIDIQYEGDHLAKRGYQTLLWETITEADSAAAYEVPEGIGALGAIQVNGTFGSASVALHGSEDGTNYYALNDLSNTAIAITSAGRAEFTTAARYIKPVPTGGSSQDLDVRVTLRKG